MPASGVQAPDLPRVGVRRVVPGEAARVVAAAGRLAPGLLVAELLVVVLLVVALLVVVPLAAVPLAEEALGADALAAELFAAAALPAAVFGATRPETDTVRAPVAFLTAGLSVFPADGRTTLLAVFAVVVPADWLATLLPAGDLALVERPAGDLAAVLVRVAEGPAGRARLAAAGLLVPALLVPALLAPEGRAAAVLAVAARPGDAAWAAVGRTRPALGLPADLAAPTVLSRAVREVEAGLPIGSLALTSRGVAASPIFRRTGFSPQISSRW